MFLGEVQRVPKKVSCSRATPRLHRCKSGLLQSKRYLWDSGPRPKRLLAPSLILGARLRGRTATQRSKKGSEKVLGRVLGKGFSEGF